MEIIKSQQSTVMILTPKGSMIAGELDPLDSEVGECIDTGRLRIVLEMDQVPFIDSAGLEKIQDLVSEVNKCGGDVRVTGLNNTCQDIFQATRMERFIYVLEDRDAAIRSLLL